MSPAPENHYIFTKLLPIRKAPWKTTFDDKIHVIIYYHLKKSGFKNKTQITPK